MTDETRKETAMEPIVVDCVLAESPEKVWRALTVPDLLAAWMMPNDIKPETGSRFAFDKADAPIECEILDAEPGRRLRYSWREKVNAGQPAAFDSVVTFTLDRTVSGGTHLRIVHDGFAQATPVVANTLVAKTVAAQPLVAMTGAGCRLSLDAPASPVLTSAANGPRLLSLAA
jgi:uncharacterized protein YndB with AHSA1/START domain